MIFNFKPCLAFVGGGNDGVLQRETQTSMRCIQRLTKKSDNTLATAKRKNQLTNLDATWSLGKTLKIVCRTAFIARINANTYLMTSSNKPKTWCFMLEFESWGCPGEAIRSNQQTQRNCSEWLNSRPLVQHISNPNKGDVHSHANDCTSKQRSTW